MAPKPRRRRDDAPDSLVKREEDPELARDEGRDPDRPAPAPPDSLPREEEENTRP
jgi:hypothetical protein